MGRGRFAACGVQKKVMPGALLAVALVAMSGQQAAKTSQQTSAPQQAPVQSSGQATVAAQTTTGAQSTAGAQADGQASDSNLPVSLDRIERALAAPPPFDFTEQHPVFRLEIFGRKPSLEDIMGERFWVGPVSYGGMTHREFMDMSTPKELQPYGGFSGKYLVAETVLTLAEEWAVKAAIHKFKSAKSDHERDAARKEVLDALDELEKARKAAGLDK